MERKIVYVCSPLKGNYEKNTVKANLYCRYAFEKGCIPLAPHVIFPQFLDDRKKTERKQGMDMGLQLLKRCDELWVFGSLISEGMKAEIEFAKANKIKTRHIKEEDLEDW